MHRSKLVILLALIVLASTVAACRGRDLGPTATPAKDGLAETALVEEGSPMAGGEETPLSSEPDGEAPATASPREPTAVAPDDGASQEDSGGNSVDQSQQATFDRLARAEPPKRDDLELARLYQGWSDEQVPTPAAPEPLQLGTVQTLYVLNHDDNRMVPIEAALLGVSDHAYFWFDTGSGSVQPSEAELASTEEAFDQIYEQGVAIFGPENNPGIDGDPRLHVVNASPLAMCSVTLAEADRCGIAGYYSSTDALPAAVDPYSNVREMFVMNAGYFGSDYYLLVLAHEFRHLIENNYDPGDIDWESEGSAVLAASLLGYSDDGARRANLFLENPDQQLNRWTNEYTAPYYGQAYLFNRYLYDRLGPDLYRQFAASPVSGLQALDEVAQANGLDVTGQELWLDWLAALALHGEPGAADVYRLGPDGLNTVTMTEVSSFPATYEDSVHQYAADYYLLDGQENVTIDFIGSEVVPLIDTMPSSGESMWLANRANYSHMQLTREIDLREVSSATLQYDIYHDIEVGYDFGYLFVSADNGQTWQPLIAPNMQGLQPEDDPSDSALAERFYTGRSAGWQTETIDLTPYAGQRVLLRFAYVTDPILTFGGLALDNITVPEIGFFDDAESLDAGWVAEGFDRVTGEIPQQWHLQLITFTNGVPSVETLALNERYSTQSSVSLRDSGGQAILIVAATAPMTLEQAHYRLTVEET